jgi:hypothetical protein
MTSNVLPADKTTRKTTARSIRRIGTSAGTRRFSAIMETEAMGRYLLLWLFGIPIPLLVLIWLLGGLH